MAPVHQVERARLQHQIVHHVDFVRPAIGDVNETGDVAAQVQQRMQLDGRLGCAIVAFALASVLREIVWQRNPM